MKKQFNNLDWMQVNNCCVETYNTVKEECTMENLENIIKGYRELFERTGKIEFFMRAKNIERLQKNISLVEEIGKENDLML